jgi:hypothetical protein
MVRATLIFLSLCCCGPPVLRKVPQPNPTAVAAGAAAAAAALTLADPQAAARKQEMKKEGAPEGRATEVDEMVPPDVLDRLDQAQQRDAGVDPP